VRLFTRNGNDCTDRYPLIVEAALRNRATSFVIDGEAVLLGVDGISDFNGLHSRRHNDEVRLYAFEWVLWSLLVLRVCRFNDIGTFPDSSGSPRT
jgi:bifunctional non-homologous end joining protein LigD